MKGRTLSIIKTGLINYIRGFDKLLALAVLAISALGVVVIRSATASSPSLSRCVPIQMLAIALGFVAMLIISKMDYDKLCDLYVPIAIASFGVLFATALLAKTIGGNANWISMGMVNIQPSEFTKAAFIITMSAHISRLGKELNRPRNMIAVVVHFLLYFVPVVLQGDIGSSLIYIGTFVVILYVSGVLYRYFIIAAVFVVAAVPAVWQFLQTYQKARIIYGFHPELDPLKYGYQPLVAKMALASGEFDGLGYMNGIQIQNDLLPAKHTDFIYAVVGEEFGFIGCIVVLLLLVAIVLLILRGVTRISSNRGRMICIGAAFIIVFQTCINIGMVIGVSPVIGVTLPFMSYGGSSVLSMFVIIGLVESVRVKEDSLATLQFGNGRRGRFFN